MDIVKFYDCYNFNEEWYLIEMVLDMAACDINWIDICVPQAAIPKSSWQCAFLEQYLNEDGTEKVCETYDVPEENTQPCRIAFFIFKGEEKILSTPYGDFELSSKNAVPERLKQIIEFEEED